MRWDNWDIGKGIEKVLDEKIATIGREVAGNSATLKALTQRVKGIANIPRYAAATASSSAKGKEKAVTIQEPAPPSKGTKRPLPSNATSRAQSPKQRAVESSQFGELPLDTPENWAVLHDVADIGSIVPNIDPITAFRLARGQRDRRGLTLPVQKVGLPNTTTTKGGQAGTPSPSAVPAPAAAPMARGHNPTVPPVTAPSTASASAPFKALVRHVPLPGRALSTKTVRVLFGRILDADNERPLFANVQQAITAMFAGIGSANYVASGTWSRSENELYLTFGEHPTDPEMGLLVRDLANVLLPPQLRADGMEPVSVRVELAHTLTQLAIRAVPKYRVAKTKLEYSLSELEKELRDRNPKLAEHLKPFEQAPRARMVGAAGGSGTLVVTIADTKSGRTSTKMCALKIKLFDKWHSVAPWYEADCVPLCPRCWRWGHPAPICKATHEHCERCGEPHISELHDRMASCCAQRRVVLKAEELPCPESHDRCPNCGTQGHRASYPKCSWAKHARNKKWHSENPPKVPAAKAAAVAATVAKRARAKGRAELAKGSRFEGLEVEGEASGIETLPPDAPEHSIEEMYADEETDGNAEAGPSGAAAQ
ncbi:uncharacterized protein FIBRA_09211 [Fibroporia radiculosa]|uniref:Uncharacterized protein n=1 Tax=Fibroporia radiculosa TaxID=599839 RepID=J7SC56_9APHY|nr:uncharacterized protein FIBRA_09211 [Fibroporia radiculosa]CCM06901.1 predicted protein [Fibroporia radiculosa]